MAYGSEIYELNLLNFKSGSICEFNLYLVRFSKIKNWLIGSKLELIKLIMLLGLRNYDYYLWGIQFEYAIYWRKFWVWSGFEGVNDLRK